MQSVNRGSYEMMIDRMVSFNTGYIQLQDYRYEEEAFLDNAFYYDEEIRDQVPGADDRIVHGVPRIETFMLAANAGFTRGLVVLGVDPDRKLRRQSRLNLIGRPGRGTG